MAILLHRRKRKYSKSRIPLFTFVAKISYFAKIKHNLAGPSDTFFGASRIKSRIQSRQVVDWKLFATGL